MRANYRPVKTVLLKELANVVHGWTQVFFVVGPAKTQLGRADNLVPVGRFVLSFHADAGDEIVEFGSDRERHPGAIGSTNDRNVGITPRRIQPANRGAKLV